MLDFNEAASPRPAWTPADNARRVADLKARLEGCAESVLTHLWPAGRIVGSGASREFEVGSINGEAGRSLKISLKRGKVGVGQDFAGGEVTGDLLDAWAFATRGRKATGKDFVEVCEEAEAWLGRPFKAPPAATAPASPAPPLGPPTAIYNYTDPDGKILVTIKRHDPPGQPKTFRQYDAVRNGPNMPPDNRPLYNLPGIVREPWVVFTEGEKAADALIVRGIPATCAMGGAKAPTEKTNWSPLAGKNVIIWPDADEPGAAYAEAVGAAMTAAGARPSILSLPPGKSGGWDAADAVAEGLDPAALLSTPARKKPGRQIDFARWSAASFSGEPKPIEWLVENVMPLGKAGLLVAMGDAGKGILTLDLALKIVGKKPPPGLTDDHPTSLGGRVAATGRVVILAAEDDREAIHRRLHGLDPTASRRDGLTVVPLPNDGGPLAIVKTSSTQGPYATPEWEMLRQELLAVPDLRLIVFDPLASFVHADVNADPAAGAFVTGMLASLATETGATVLLPHHMAKRQTPITTPEEARAAIRGSTAIVDGVRFAYAIWGCDERESRRICEGLGEEWERSRVMKGAIVKTNEKADRSIRTYVRSLETGLLLDRSDAIRADKSLARGMMLDDLCMAITTAAAAGYPYTKSGSTSAWERRGELPESLQDIGKHTLAQLVERLLMDQRLCLVRYRGQASNWLDSPSGDFANGRVDLRPGAYEP